MCSEPCFQGVLQSLQYLGEELASPQGLDPQDVFLAGLELNVLSCPQAGVSSCCPCRPETSGQDRNSLCNVKFYQQPQELSFEDHKALQKVSKGKYIPVCSLALAQVLDSPWFSNMNAIERGKNVIALYDSRVFMKLLKRASCHGVP